MKGFTGEELRKFAVRLAAGVVILCAAAAISFAVLFFSLRHTLEFDPAPKDADRIVIYGDTRSQHLVHDKIVKTIEKENPDMVLFTGDMVSNGSNPIHWMIYTMIDSALWKKSEYYPTRGNHERDLFWYEIFMDLPEDKTYYSFDRGGMHFIVLDVIEVEKPMDAEQKAWLKADLEKNAGKPISVSMHVPLYTSGKYYPYGADPELKELFKKYGVLFVFSAHCHAYERSYNDGVNYVVTAGGGAPLYEAVLENPNKVVRVQNYHYCLLESRNDEFILTVKDIDGKVIDELTVSAPRPLGENSAYEKRNEPQ